MKGTIIGTALMLSIFSVSTSNAQEATLGEAEFINSCAQCHGLAGKGDGVLSEHLKSTVPDLTRLSESNGGIFPVARVYSLIDGTEASGIHGTREMPVWGLRYSEQAEEEMESFTIGFEDRRRAFVRGRILALVEYLSTLQAD